MYVGFLAPQYRPFRRLLLAVGFTATLLIFALNQTRSLSVDAPHQVQVRLPLWTPPPQVSRSDEGAMRIEFSSRAAMLASGVSVVPIEMRPITEEIVAQGIVTYDQRLVTRLSSRAAGTIRFVEKRWGERVQKGDVLAIVESLEIGRWKADFLDRLALAEAKAEHAKLLELGGAAIPVSSLREARLQLREARIHLLNAEQTLINLGIPMRLAQFEPLSDEERAAKIRFLGLPEEIVARLDTEETANLVPLVAPFDGVVIRHDVGDGEWADPTKPLFEIADPRRMCVHLEVSGEDVNRIQLGQELTFRPEGLHRGVTCRLTWIGTEIDRQSHRLEVRAQVDNPLLNDSKSAGADTEHRLLRANETGVGRIRVRQCLQALAVPCECVQSEDDENFLFVQDSDRSFLVIPVERGATDGKYVEVCGPVSADSIVASRGWSLLRSALPSGSTLGSRDGDKPRDLSQPQQVPPASPGKLSSDLRS